jgi:hypothetical protein
MTLIRGVPTSPRKNDWSFLEQNINIKFCVKLGKNESDICIVLSED